MVPTGAGIFSPHFLQRIVKSHCRVSGRLNTRGSIGEEKAKIQGVNLAKCFRAIIFESCKRIYFNELTRLRLHQYMDSGTMRGKVDRTAMRIASSPTLRIAAGLFLAALLSIVGYKVFRRLISHGPEALLERADVLVRLVCVDLIKPSDPSREQRVDSPSRLTR